MKSVVLIFFIAIITGILASFVNQPGTGMIEGTVYPREAKPFIQIVLPHPDRKGDTIHHEVHPNANGYFKILNLTPGNYQLIFCAREFSTFKRITRTFSVYENRTTSADTTILAQIN